ncbi:MAG TPA: hypothetical protein VFT98_01690 [Myxococcota bacterium]|nr:hypothetical protein [Myxococcota bacterium]
MSQPLVRSLAFTLAAFAPLAGFADGVGPEKPAHATEAPAPRSAERAECVGDAPIGRVASVQGDVQALSPDGSARALECDGEVRACETIVTGVGADVALLIDEAVVQLGPETSAQLSARPSPELALERGAVRVVDLREVAGERVQLYTPALSASTGRGDASVTRDGDSVRVCAHDEPIVVMARDGAKTVAAGGCLATDVSGALAASAAGDPALAVSDGAACPFHVAALPGLAPPVAAPPLAGPEIPPFEPPGRDACDDPGSGCRTVIFEDPDPGTGCGFPGSPCTGGDD